MGKLWDWMLKLFDKIFPLYKPWEKMTKDEQLQYSKMKKEERESSGKLELWAICAITIIGLGAVLTGMHYYNAETSSTTSEGSPDAKQIPPDSTNSEIEKALNLYEDFVPPSDTLWQ